MKFFVFSSFSDTEVGNALQTCLEYESPNHSKNVYNTGITPNYSYIDPLKKKWEKVLHKSPKKPQLQPLMKQHIKFGIIYAASAIQETISV